jgi:hypothetical protein
VGYLGLNGVHVIHQGWRGDHAAEIYRRGEEYDDKEYLPAVCYPIKIA